MMLGFMHIWHRAVVLQIKFRHEPVARKVLSTRAYEEPCWHYKSQKTFLATGSCRTFFPMLQCLQYMPQGWLKLWIVECAAHKAKSAWGLCRLHTVATFLHEGLCGTSRPWPLASSFCQNLLLLGLVWGGKHAFVTGQRRSVTEPRQKVCLVDVLAIHIILPQRLLHVLGQLGLVYRRRFVPQQTFIA